MRRWLSWLIIGIMGGMLAACQGLPWSFPNPVGASPTPSPPLIPTPTQTLNPTATPPAATAPVIITLWLPPQFDPANETPAAQLLQQRLLQFMSENPGVIVKVRVKTSSGPGGLLDSLAAASAAAPAAVPGVVALSRADLENAALKGLIYPLDDAFPQGLDQDWLGYARSLGTLQERLFGLPFAGDAYTLVYRPTALGAPPTSWEDLLTRGRAIAFAGNDALTTLVLYLGAGGKVQNEQGLPTLEAEALAEVFTLYTEGARRGVFPNWVTTLQSDGQVWQTFLERRADGALTWSSNYLTDLPADAVIHPIPALNGHAYTLANGWVWAISDPDPQRRVLSTRLAAYLSASDFLATWSQAAGYLPTRLSVLNAWTDANLRDALSQIILSAHIMPPNPILDSLRPVLSFATQQVLKQQADPLTASNAAVEQLRRP
ncbi:extracellular solute-binding protein [Thermanaerothrix sp.]|jgi:ABC-type glycerol-3-phosphate transport system substrate-binding protein|uniref:extracellular solute-binding protein n=1 Tax=Thermanaerothrix sp. TaxID=2972675 RepID=UPI002ADDCF38|nr:extracellular solute-binding protein [Thermanaerothrix sp.]